MAVPDGWATPAILTRAPRYHAVSSSLKLLTYDETAPLSERRMTSTPLAGDVLRHPGSAERCAHRGIHKRRLNRRRFRYPLAYLKGSARKAGEHLHSLATGGEAEPSPPWHVPGMRLHSTATHTTTVWSRPRPTDFRLAPLSSPARRASQGNPPVLDFPRALAVGTPSARAATTTSPKPVIRDGAALTTRRHCARRMACTSLHQSICIAGEHEMQIEDVCSERGNASRRVMP